jgi:hypothetical protein
MKPVNWNEMSPGERREYATEFSQGLRGMYIMAQALAVAKEELAKAKYPATSNIEDMEVLQELVPFPEEMFTGENKEGA